MIDQDVLDGYLLECERAAETRYDAGQQKYGPNKYLEIDTLQHAIDEVLDLFNYARFTYVKLRLLQDGLANKIQSNGEVALPIDGREMPGKPDPVGITENGLHIKMGD